MKYNSKKRIKNKNAYKQKQKRNMTTKPILKIKNKRIKLIKNLAKGVVGLSLIYTLLIGGMTASNIANSPYKHTTDEINSEIAYTEQIDYTRVANNIREIINIAPKGSIVYTDYCAVKNKQTNTLVFDENRVKQIQDCDEIQIFFTAQVSNEYRKEIINAINLLNNINEKTYTDIPHINVMFDSYSATIDYTSPIKDNKYNIFVFAKEEPEYSNAIAMTYLGTGIMTFNTKYSLKPEEFGNVLLHELMHEIYGFGDMYLLDDYSNTISTIMNAGRGVELSTNDIYLLDAICWDKELTIEQKQNLREFYKDFTDKNKSNDIFSIVAYKLQDLIAPVKYYDLEKD